MTDIPTPPGPDLPQMTGLEQMRAFASGALPYRGIGHTLRFRLDVVEEGRVVFAGTPGPEVYNPLGQVHGGYAATLLDSACGCAVHTRLAPGQGYTTLEIKVAYHRGMSADTGEVRAEGLVTHLGRRTAYAEARLTDGVGKLVASATSTLMIL